MKKVIEFAAVLLLVSGAFCCCSDKESENYIPTEPPVQIVPKPEIFWNGYFDEPIIEWGVRKSTVMTYYYTAKTYTDNGLECLMYGSGHLRGVSSVIYAFDYSGLAAAQIVAYMQTSTFEKAMSKRFNLRNSSGFLDKEYSYVSKDGETVVQAKKVSSGGSADSQFTIVYSKN